MEEAARRFARRILLLHLLLLVAVVLLVAAAAREIYNTTRQQVLYQAIQRQELLAGQTAGAIESYYRAILSDLQFARRVEEAAAAAGPAPRPALQLPDILWSQVETRADHVFIVSRDTLEVSTALPADSVSRARDVTTRASDWLKQVDSPAISPFLSLDKGGMNLVAVPLFDRHALVAVVPVDFIERRFLATMNRRATMSATLLDNAGRTMSTADANLIGGNVFEQLHDRTIARLLETYLQSPMLRTEVIEVSLDLDGIILPPRMVTAHPIDVGGVAWTILVASHLEEVDSIINGVFRRAIMWAIFLVISMSAILISTSVLLIRGRSRLERVEHEMLTRELGQARDIQLAWLPTNDLQTPQMKIAAYNKPANHISGDLYDWFKLPDGRMVVTIGDVTGHGMSAAFLMSTTQLLIRNTMLRVLDPAQCLHEVNRQLCTQVFSGQFVTMLICVIDTDNNTLIASTAGHFPPLVGDDTGFYPLKLNTQLVMGIDADVDYQTEQFDLPPDADVVLYTDGVIEAPNSDGDRFGMENLQTCLVGDLNRPQDVIERITEAVNEFQGGRELTDDLTIVAVRLHTAVTPSNHPAREATAI